MTNDGADGAAKKLTLGQAIDIVSDALSAFDAHQQQTILRTVFESLNISGPSLGTVQSSARGAEPPTVQHQAAVAPPRQAATGEFAGMDIKSFKELKSPSSARQMACVVAFYLSEIAEGDEKSEVVTNPLLEKYFKQARFQMPNKLEQVLPDAKAGGYFEGAARGQYRLTRVGYNLVAHQLPPKAKG
jgi:hypothetical protein